MFCKSVTQGRSETGNPGKSWKACVFLMGKTMSRIQLHSFKFLTFPHFCGIHFRWVWTDMKLPTNHQPTNGLASGTISTTGNPALNVLEGFHKWWYPTKSSIFWVDVESSYWGTPWLRKPPIVEIQTGQHAWIWPQQMAQWTEFDWN